MPKFRRFNESIKIERILGLNYPCICCIFTTEPAVIRYTFTRGKKKSVVIDLCLDHLKLLKRMQGSASRLKPKVSYGKGKPIRTMDELMVALNQRSIWVDYPHQSRCVGSQHFKNMPFNMVSQQLKEGRLYYRIPTIDPGVAGLLTEGK